MDYALELKNKYLNYCNSLFDLSVELGKHRQLLSQTDKLNTIYPDIEQKYKGIEQKLLSLCASVKDEFDSTSPKTPEVKALLEFMNALYQGNFGTK